MSTSAKGKIRRCSALGNETVAVVELLLVLFRANNGCGRIGVAGFPAVGIPGVGVGEVGGVGGGDNGGGKEGVGVGDDPVTSGNRHGRLDLTHDTVNGSVQTEGFLDDVGVERELGQVLVRERREIGAQGFDLFLVELFHDFGVLGETKHNPGAGRGG